MIDVCGNLSNYHHLLECSNLIIVRCMQKPQKDFLLVGTCFLGIRLYLLSTKQIIKIKSTWIQRAMSSSVYERREQNMKYSLRPAYHEYWGSEQVIHPEYTT